MAIAVHKYKKPDIRAQIKGAQKKPVERLPTAFEMIRGRVHRYPMPTPEENARLYTRIAAARIAGKGQLAERLLGDLAVRNQRSILTIIFQPWVQYYARVYGIPLADLFQSGFIGMTRALKYWNPEKGAVAAYCNNAIKQDLWARISEDAPIPHSVDSHKRKNDFEGVLRFIEGKKLPLSKAVIENSGLTTRQRRELRRLKSERDVSQLKLRTETLRHYLAGAAKPHASLDAEVEEGRTLHEKIPGKTYERTALPGESLKPNATIYLTERLAPKRRMIVLLANLQLLRSDKRLKELAERTAKELGSRVDEQGILKCLRMDTQPIFAEIGVFMGYPEKSAAQSCHMVYKTAMKQLERLTGARAVGATFRKGFRKQYSDVKAPSTQYRWAYLDEKKALLRRLGVSDRVIQQFPDSKLQKLPSGELERIVPRLMESGLEEGVPLLTGHSLYRETDDAVSFIREKLGRGNKKS